MQTRKGIGGFEEGREEVECGGESKEGGKEGKLQEHPPCAHVHTLLLSFPPSIMFPVLSTRRTLKAADDLDLLLLLLPSLGVGGCFPLLLLLVLHDHVHLASLPPSSSSRSWFFLGGASLPLWGHCEGRKSCLSLPRVLFCRLAVQLSKKWEDRATRTRRKEADPSTCVLCVGGGRGVSRVNGKVICMGNTGTQKLQAWKTRSSRCFLCPLSICALPPCLCTRECLYGHPFTALTPPLCTAFPVHVVLPIPPLFTLTETPAHDRDNLVRSIAPPPPRARSCPPPRLTPPATAAATSPLPPPFPRPPLRL